MAKSTKKKVPLSFLGSLENLDNFFRRQKIKYCLIGGIAVIFRGEPRLTADIDITVALSLEGQENLILKMLEVFNPRIENAADFADRNKVLLISDSGTQIDVGIGLSGFEHECVDRSSLVTISKSLKLPVASAEDLAILKCIAGRPKDIADIEGLILRNGRKLDIKYIRQKLAEFESLLDTADLVGMFDSQLKKSRM